MYPIDAIYGPKTYRAFEERGPLNADNLRSTLQTSKQACSEPPLEAKSYSELVELVSFFSVMNKRSSMHFRGQGDHWSKIVPAIFRAHWTSLGQTRHTLSKTSEARRQVWDCLQNEISPIVYKVCGDFPMPRRRTLEMFREAVWAIVQHYELWPTPLIDVTPNLRVAASFALLGGRTNGSVYVFALPASTNSLTFDADQHVVLARLQAVCPPVAKRPHYQDGFLVGRFPFLSPNPNAVDSDPERVSNLNRRFVARIDLRDSCDFWSEDFPMMSAAALMLVGNNDNLLSRFRDYTGVIDEKMQKIQERY